jgi:hypothetical protein
MNDSSICMSLESNTTQETWEDMEPLYYLPNTFKKIEKSIVNTLIQLGYPTICQAYAMEKESLLDKIEFPHLVTMKDLDDKFVFDRVAQFRHASLFKNLAENSSVEVKPILMYYSMEQMLNSFCKCIVKFKGSKPNHGITVNYSDSLYDTKIIIEKRGFFSRTVDTYSILGTNSVFSALKFRQVPYLDSIDYYENTHKFALKKTVELSLGDLINTPPEDKISSDLRTVLLLYIGSAFSRYRPYLWNRIISGIDNDIILHINRSYANYNFIFRKLIIALNG